MKNLKNETGMKTEQNTLNLSQPLFEILENLQDSPVFDEEYYSTTENLCNAVSTIAGDISRLASEIEDHREKTGVVLTHFFDWINKRAWQIQSISEIIAERTYHEDFTEISNLLHFYKETKEQ